MVELKGSLKGMGLRPLVRLLSDLGKTGCLHLAEEQWHGELHFRGGRLVGARVGSEEGVDALDALVLALPNATFTFTDGEKPPEREFELQPDDVQAHLAAADERSGGLLQRIPSMDAWLTVIEADQGHASENVQLDRTTVQTLLRVNGGRTVVEVVDGRPLVQTLRDLGRLVDLGLVRAATAPAVVAAREMPAPTSAPVPTRLAGPQSLVPTPTPREPVFEKPANEARPASAAVTCPKLGFADDPSNLYSRPTSLHRCYASGAAAQVSHQEQRDLCLSGEFARCSRFTRSPAGRAAAALPGSPPALPRRPPAAGPPPAQEPIRQPVDAGLPRVRQPLLGAVRELGGGPARLDADLDGENGQRGARDAAPGASQAPAPLTVRRPTANGAQARVAPPYPRPEASQRVPRLLVVSLVLGALLVALGVYVMKPLTAGPELGSAAAPVSAPIRSPAAAKPVAGLTRPTPAGVASSPPATAPTQESAPAPAAAPVAPAAAPSQPPAVAAAPAPAPAPAPIDGFHTVLDAQFGTDQPRWLKNGSLVGWTDGAYRISAQQPTHFVAVGAPLKEPVTDAVVSATFRKLAGPAGGGYGLIVRDQGPGPRDGAAQEGNFYVAEAGDRGEFGIWRRELDRWIDIVPWTRTDAVHASGTANTLTVRAIGNQLTFLINGTEVASRTDATLPSGGVGAFVGGDGNVVALDRFTVQAPN